MWSRPLDWLDAQPRPRRRIYATFIALVLLTVPCYGTAVVLIVVGGSPAERPPDAVVTPTLEGPTSRPTARVPASEPSPEPTIIRRRGDRSNSRRGVGSAGEGVHPDRASTESGAGAHGPPHEVAVMRRRW